MPFPFTYVCDLLQQLDDELHSTKKQKAPNKAIIARWFKEHRSRLTSVDNDASTVLSTLLPERRTDRVYCIQATRLHSIIGHALGLGYSRVLELRRHETPGSGVDLGDCVESILKSTPNPVQDQELSVEKIDAVLAEIAAASRFSSPKIRASRQYHGEKYANRVLGSIYVRLSARDAKWLTRLILKNYQPVVLDEYTVFSSYHVLLPQLLKVRDDLTITTAFLRHVNQSAGDYDRIVSVMKPKLGIKVGRQPWFKGRSVKNCLDMIRGRPVSVEQKIDGEYCQIHIDLSKGHHCIQIFSKSGKDSTNDRAALHSKLSLQPSEVVMLKELRAYGHEHLMIIYYDALMVDNQSLLTHCQSERRKRLTDLVTCREGYAEIVQSQIIACSKPTAAAELREAFAKCITSREEGIVIKPDTPYFDFSTHQEPYACCNIKLKKEYIQGWGDVGDFAVIGAGYEAAAAKAYQIRNLKWTHFYIGCLQNRNQVKVGNEQARFMVVNIVELTETMMKTFLAHYNPEIIALEEQDMYELELHGIVHTKPPTVVFANPVVFDVRCFSFDKEPNSRYWSMRFPVVSKIHFDRSYIDAITFDDLQEAAKTAIEMPQQEDSQEMRNWIRALEKADPRGIAVDAISQDSTSSESTISPRRITAEEHRREGNGAVGEDLGLAKPAYAKGPLALPTPPTSSALGPESAPDTLLKEHGITEFIVDPTSWTRGKSSNSSGPRTRGSPAKKSRPNRVRKICLVESRRQEATHAFLKKLEEANLKTKSGNREWVAVYDWRVLEKATELESGERGVGNYDPWRQFYFGLA
ncbi:hypothetical protein DL768_007029 [Monosporascus sp. mg162]|nr:hypothetical protein DL768_007029 [Monosporascus sp. mg162]